MSTTRIQRLTMRCTVEPTVEPVTVAQVKAHCRIDEGDEDAFLGTLITAARELVEEQTHRALIDQTWRVTLDRFPIGILNDPTSPAIEGFDIILPRPNLLAVESITYVDEDGATQTLDEATYIAGLDDTPGRISLAFGETWPSTRCQAGAVVITYRAGYADNTPGDDESTTPVGAETQEQANERAAAAVVARVLATQAAVPQRIKQAIFLLVAQWHENREIQVIGTIATSLSFTVDALLGPATVREQW